MITPIRRPQPIASINITNLVDVTMVLLIIFMIVTPLINEGIEVDPPQTESRNPLDSGKNIMITITGDGELFLQGQPYSGLDSLRNGLAHLSEQHADWPVLVKCDRDQSFNLFFQVMGVAQKVRPTGKIGIVGGPPLPETE